MTSRVREIGYHYGVAALRKKRAELDGEIAQLMIALRHRRGELAKVDEVLLILAPNADPSTLPPKKAIKYLNVFRHGELGRLIIGLLRSHDRPMTNLELARTVFQRGGFRKGLWGAIRRRTRANLAYLELQGRVRKEGHGITSCWTLTNDEEKSIIYNGIIKSSQKPARTFCPEA